MGKMALPLMALGTAVSFVGGMRQAKAIRASGKARQAEAEVAARQEEALALQDRAAAQRKFLGEQRKSDIAMSRARALAAKGGGGIDLAAADVMSVLAAEGGYREDLAMYEGENAVLRRKDRATALRYEGLQAKRAANARAKAKTIGVIGNTLLSAGSMARKGKGEGSKGEGSKGEGSKGKSDG